MAEMDSRRVLDCSAGDSKLSRRSFVKAAAVGAAGASFALTGERAARAANDEVGEITLDAMLLTYASAPIGWEGITWYELGRAFTTTLKLESAVEAAPRLVAGVSPNRAKVFAGTRFEQSESARVAGGLVLDQKLGRGAHDRFGTQGGTPESTTFIGLLRPRFRLAGTTDRLRFSLVGASAEFITSVDALRREVTAPDLFTAATAAAMLAQYVPSESALVAPRYEFRRTVQAPFKLVEEAGTEPPQRVTATLSSTIVARTGFESSSLADVFRPDRTVDVTYTSVQEDPSGVLMTVDARDATATLANNVYWDTVFKTFVFVPAA